MTLLDTADTVIAHGLGRLPRWIGVSCVRGYSTVTGQVVEVRSGTLDRRRFAVLRAEGFGADVTADILVL